MLSCECVVDVVLQSLQHRWIHAESEGDNSVWNVLDDGKFTVQAATLKHTVTSFGYALAALSLKAGARG